MKLLQLKHVKKIRTLFMSSELWNIPPSSKRKHMKSSHSLSEHTPTSHFQSFIRNQEHCLTLKAVLAISLLCVLSLSVSHLFVFYNISHVFCLSCQFPQPINIQLPNSIGSTCGKTLSTCVGLLLTGSSDSFSRQFQTSIPGTRYFWWSWTMAFTPFQRFCDLEYGISIMCLDPHPPSYSVFSLMDSSPSGSIPSWALGFILPSWNLGHPNDPSLCSSESISYLFLRPNSHPVLFSRTCHLYSLSYSITYCCLGELPGTWVAAGGRAYLSLTCPSPQPQW